MRVCKEPIQCAKNISVELALPRLERLPPQLLLVDEHQQAD
jgi:hypothetical protein